MSEEAAVRKLRNRVMVTHPETREVHYFDPGGEDEIPEWALAKLEDSPTAWDDTPRKRRGSDETTSIFEESTLKPTGNTTTEWEKLADSLANLERGPLFEEAKRLGLEPGVDFPKRAGKPVILAAIRHYSKQPAE